MMYQQIKEKADSLVNQFSTIPVERKKLLQKISNFIQERKDANEQIRLMYVCTHNSRRSHFGQVWGQVAAAYYGVKNVETFSGGVEVTAFNPNAIKALEKTGFRVEKTDESVNPLYKVFFSEVDFASCFSKMFDDPKNPDEDFAAIMVCSEAEENCPFVSGAALRLVTSYEDPGKFDGTNRQDEVYLERSSQIALENLYLFSLIK